MEAGDRLRNRALARRPAHDLAKLLLARFVKEAHTLTYLGLRGLRDG